MEKKHILERIQVNMPFRMLLEEYFPIVLEEKLNLEIGFDCLTLDSYGYDDYREAARILSDIGSRITLHAPFHDLRPGALDQRIRKVTEERLKQVFELVPLFKPLSVVCHAAFDRRYYVSNEDLWLENSVLTWMSLIREAESMGTMLLLENVYEDGATELKRLFDRLGGSNNLGICFDTGHWNAFASTPLEVWIEMIGPLIREIHLHDNHGDGDRHLPPGDGTFPFAEFFEYLEKKKIRPIVTVEPHTVEDLHTTLERIIAMRIFPEP